MIRFLSLSLLLFLLTACGFQRVHQPALTTAPQRYVIKINGGEGHLAYQFKRELEKHFATWPQQCEATYHITLNLKPEEAEISYGQDATVLRSQERLQVSYVVTKAGSAEPIYNNTASLASSFNITVNQEFATLSARQAAKGRVVNALAEEVARDIMFHLR